jgi:alkyl hydroperoxide reductase subunit AhpC
MVSGTSTVRSAFVVGPDDRVKLTLTCRASTGRNFDELLRVVGSLQLTDSQAVATPVNWRRGDDVIIVPSLSDEQARERFPQCWVAHTPYLRVVPEPGR